MTSKNVIVSDPRIMLGQPVFAGTHLTVDSVLEQLARGVTVDQLLALHPELSPDAIRAALKFAAETIRATAVIAIEPLDLHGPRPTTVDEQPAIAVRAFMPEAEAVDVVREAPAPQMHPPAAEDRAQLSLSQPVPPPSEPVAVVPVSHANIPMELIHPAGVFEAVFPGETEFFPYQLAVGLPGGQCQIIEDPYRFPPMLEVADLRRFAEGRDFELYQKLGAHPRVCDGVAGVFFAVWAPNAQTVSVAGDFNHWDARCHPMRARGDTGLWELFIPGLKPGTLYKYALTSQRENYKVLKADPYAFAAELRPETASVVWDLDRYVWHDHDWLTGRRQRQSLAAPLSIYEVHLGSWKRSLSDDDPHGPGRWLTYRELADKLIPYVQTQGYTHLELMPVAEHPFDGSWGYQITGYFAPTARHGTPDDFRYFVDRAHQAGLGVLLDWVPGHFPKDEHGLGYFDGTPLYEPADWRRSQHRDWGTLAFNFERAEVRAFLLSNALFWLDAYHVDGLRVDAVSSMLYLDYSRREGEWLPNKFGGRENLDAIAFLRQFNDLVHARFPGALTFAEEATAWPKVTGPTGEGGLGFDFKWNMGWMHDTLEYAQKDPLYRRYHHNTLTFSLTYAFSEHFTLPFSHDEVVYGKRALLNKMPGDYAQKFANLRAFFGYMYGHPGKKLVFMGGEFGQWDEWNHDKGLDWMLLEHPAHQEMLAYGRALNGLYLTQPALYEVDGDWRGFQWLDCDDADRSTLSFLRRAKDENDSVVVIVNFTPVAREGYRVGVPAPGYYRELLNSDAAAYGGSGRFAVGPFMTEAQACQGQPYAITLTLPPLAVVFLKKQ